MRLSKASRRVLALVLVTVAFLFMAAFGLAMANAESMPGMDMGGAQQGQAQPPSSQIPAGRPGPGEKHPEIKLTENDQKGLAGVVATVVGVPILSWAVFHEVRRRKRKVQG